MWRGQRVSVILPTYNELDSLPAAVDEAWRVGCVDEVLVVDNNATPGSEDAARRAGARVVREPVQGYGAAIRRGLSEARGDLLVVSEPDGTFAAHDVIKLLAYSDDFDVVYGTRTTLQLIWGGANMGWFLRIGNMAVAKYAELLYNTNQLTDVGCTMRLLRRSAYEEMAPRFRVTGSHFGVEMMVLSFLLGHRVIQVPVNYRKRVGVSSVTGSKVMAIGVGLRMIGLLTRHRLTGGHRSRPPQRDDWAIETTGRALGAVAREDAGGPPGDTRSIAAGG
ncbi:MAG TPA: glycosyltransferase family 2 protein [Candidatus Dormibacteraeota bacterium]|nr:glycosyltransferase family 2 protein [Candidatus Dormibacteraeota bacterium]